MKGILVKDRVSYSFSKILYMDTLLSKISVVSFIHSLHLEKMKTIMCLNNLNPWKSTR